MEGAEGLVPGQIYDGLCYASKKEKDIFKDGHRGHKFSHYWLYCPLVAVTNPSADGKWKKMVWLFHLEF